MKLISQKILPPRRSEAFVDCVRVLVTIYLLLTEGQGRVFAPSIYVVRSPQIAKDSDSGALVRSGLLNPPDLREF
jgi:hypothetical protein